MSSETQTVIADITAKRPRGRPRLPRDENGKIIRTGKRKGKGRRTRLWNAGAAARGIPLRGILNLRIPDWAFLALDAYSDDTAQPTRATAARELVLEGLERWYFNRTPPQPVKQSLFHRLRRAWAVLCGKA